MSTELVLLAGLMALATYPSRAIPLLVPGIERLPDAALRYLRLVGPAVLAAIAASNTLVSGDTETPRTVSVGIEALAVVACVAVVAWRRNLFMGLATAVLLVAVTRALG